MAKSCLLLGTAIYLDCLDCDEKACQRKRYKYKKVVIGIDQSYQNTGICVIADGEKKKLRSIELFKLENNTERRRVLRESLDSLLSSVVPKAGEVMCIIERIRLQSKGFLNIDYIKSIGALNSVIVDVCAKHGIEVYSVDTRCWKAQVIGTSKGAPNRQGVPDEKWPTVQWVISQGWEEDILIDMTDTRKTKGTFFIGERKFMYNNDAADSAGIAMFGFVGDYAKLLLES